VITAKGANFGLALTFFNPYPCVTGYGGTTYRNGLTTTGPTPALNTGASCTLPPTSGVDVRGSANAPSGGSVPPAVQPDSGTGSIAVPSESTDIAQLLGLSG
jgi:phospholipid/cholesterol/gamma-HCH transport system substrate-binding protein